MEAKANDYFSIEQRHDQRRAGRFQAACGTSLARD
jgi:hypothetical protein